MNILGICGTNNKNRKSPAVWFLDQALEAAREEGAETQAIKLIDYHMKPCNSCHLCMAGKPCPLERDPEDDGDKVFEKIFWADALIFSSPVYSYQQPAIVINLIQRSRCFHELERGRYYGLKNIKRDGNPFSGKAVGNLAVSATIGQEGALYGLLHNLRGLGATPVACAGISLMDPVIKDMYRVSNDKKIKQMFKNENGSYEQNTHAREMARHVGKWVCQVQGSEVFQKIKHLIKL
jgi:multimeric flavodoxin WrbA